VWLTLLFYDFCGFRSVAVNSVYKLQFLHLYKYSLPSVAGFIWHCGCYYLFPPPKISGVQAAKGLIYGMLESFVYTSEP